MIWARNRSGAAMAASKLDRTFRLVLYDALASEAMASLTTGVFLAGFMVQLGASNLSIGLLAAVPFSVQFLQLPAVVLVERIRARRAICAWAAGIGRSFLLVAAAAPFLGAHVAIAVLIGAVIVSGTRRRCRLRLEFLDARPGARIRLRPLLRPPFRGDDRARD